MLLAFSAHAELAWDFEAPYAHPDAIDGIYGYAFPSRTSPGQSPNHTAALSRAFLDGTTVAKLRFRLDGRDFPSAGIGIMFDGARPLDLRGLTHLRATLSADRPRKVRLALMSADPLLKLSADTGLTFGRDTLVGTAPVEWSIPLAGLSWPNWAIQPPAISREAILAGIFAVQLQVTCENKAGICSQDSGWITLDDLRLEGAGNVWGSPRIGDCGGEAISIDSFRNDPSRRNDLGGWWYAYSDRSAQDTNALGTSRILDASVPESAQTWFGPSLETASAGLSFHLQRKGVYSGYAAIETQLAPPRLDVPQPADFPAASALSFEVDFTQGFPRELGGLIVHLRKQGKDFEAGADHQVRIPWDSTSRRWCLDLAGFEQPSWSRWIVPFTPTSLVALSFEARLPATLQEAKGSFEVRGIRLHAAHGSRVGDRGFLRRPRVFQEARSWRVQLPEPVSTSASWDVVGLDGSVLDRGSLGMGEAFVSVPKSSRGSLAFLRIRTGRDTWTLSLRSF